MTLSVQTALSGLATAQQGLSVISTNLANINNADYSRKVLSEKTLNYGAGATGVQIGEVARQVDESLNSSVRQANSQQTQLTALNSYYSQIQTLFGQPNDTNSLSSLLQTLGSAFDTIASTPTTSMATAAQAASTLANRMKDVTGQIQTLRQQADADVGSAVTSVNSILQNLYDLNNNISSTIAKGGNADDMLDQRDAALKKLSAFMSFTSFKRDDGTVAIYTQNGTPLVDGRVAAMSHNTAFQVSASMTVDNGSLDGVMVGGRDISPELGTGKLSALLSMRDQVLTNLQSQLDNLGETLTSQINTISNRGNSWPNGGQVLTGTKVFTEPGSELMNITGGDTSIVLIGANGAESARTTVKTLMQQAALSASPARPVTSSWTPQQMATAVNGWINTQYNTSNVTYAQITTAGKFSVQLPQNNSTSIAFRDQRTTTFSTSLSSDNLASASGGQAVGLTGTITFRNAQGSAYSATVLNTDSLEDIRAKIQTAGGGALTAALVADGSASAPTYRLQVQSATSTDLTVDPDSGAATVVSKLGLVPSRSEPSADVTVTTTADNRGTVFNSAAFPVGAASVGTTAGNLYFRNGNGLLGTASLTAGMTLAQVKTAINTACNGTVNATIVATGNQEVLQITDMSGGALSIDGSNAAALGFATTSVDRKNGFSGFLGLNDLFVSDQPVNAYDSKTLLSFTSTSASTLNITDGSWRNGDPDSINHPNAAQALTISLKAGMTLKQIADQINTQAGTYDGVHTSIGSFSATASQISINAGSSVLGPVNVAAGATLAQIATSINTAADASSATRTVRAMVGSDGTNEWLRLYNQSGEQLSFTGSFFGTMPGQTEMARSQAVKASVIKDGSGERLQVVSSESSNQTLTLSGSLLTQTAMSPYQLNASAHLGVRTDISQDPSLMARGVLQYDGTQDKYYASSTDNSAVLALGQSMQAHATFQAAGGLGQQSVSLTDYAAAIVTNNAQQANAVGTQLSYQSTLQASLELQRSNVSSVNLDTEVAKLVVYQQAYQASAKVISTMQTLFDTLNNMIR